MLDQIITFDQTLSEYEQKYLVRFPIAETILKEQYLLAPWTDFDPLGRIGKPI